MVPAMVERLTERVETLRGRIWEGADFARLLASNSFRTASGGAYVMPLALRASAPLDAAGGFVQPMDEVLSVVLVRPSEDPQGGREMARMSGLISEVIGALAGWRPSQAIAPIRLVQGRMINIGAGVLVYQLEFAVARQLRINPT